jgi:predicted permease
MRLSRYFLRRRWDEERADEIKAHLAHEIDDNLERGMTAEEARRHAYIRLGNPTKIREQIWTMNSFSGLETFARDLRYACRQLARSRWFTLTAILTLGVGIGSITAIFGVLDAVLLEPLPFPQPDRLVAIRTVPNDTSSMPTIQDWQRRSSSFQSIAAYRNWSPQVRTPLGSGGRVIEVSQNFLSTLGTSVEVGQDFVQTGNERDCLQQVVLSGRLWKQFGGGADLGGRRIELDHRTFRVAGVLPVVQTIEGPYALNHPDIFVPIGCDPNVRVAERGETDFQVLGRLRKGISIGAATADIAHAAAALQKDYPHMYGGTGIYGHPPKLLPWLTVVTGTDTGPSLLVAFAACGLLLLIACANLANLMLARNVRRRHEFAMRATLGANARQLLRQLLFENAVLVIAGSVTGVLLANGVIRLLRAARALRVPRLDHASISVPVLVFVVSVACMVVISVTFLSARRTLRPGLLRDLAGHGRASEGGSLRRTGRILVAAQIAVSTVLVAGASWMVASVYTLLHQPLGFSPDNLLMVGVDIQHSSALPAYNAVQAASFYRATVDALGYLPGITSVAATKNPPLGSAINQYDFCSDGHLDQCANPTVIAPDSYDITSGYFTTVGQSLLKGRDFTDADNAGSPVVIVNQVLAEREWPGMSAIGHRIRTGELNGWATVVGVVGNVHSYSLEATPGPDLYLPMTYAPPTHMVFLLRTASDPSSYMEMVRRLIQSQHRDLLFYHLRTMRQEMNSEVELRSFLMQVAAVFGVLSLALSILGVYGLLAYEVSLRRKEVGIRIALGSSRLEIVRLVLQQESQWILAGAAIGLIAAIVSGYALRSQIYGVRENSLTVLGASLVLLMIPALIAITVPARQVAHSDSLLALRTE